MDKFLEITFSLFVLTLSVLTLIKSASYVEESLVLIAKKLKFDEFILGFVVLALTTSLPEIGVAVFASNENPQISLGNLIGATTVLLSLVIGLTAVKFKSLTFTGKFKEIDVILGIFLIFLMIPVLIDKHISITEGFLMLYFYIAYIFLVFRQFKLGLKKDMGLKKIHITVNQVTVLRHYYKILIALTTLILSAYFTVESATDLALDIGISQTLVGLLILGIGTNLPEIAILVLSKSDDEKKLALGNFFGSACVNVGILGLLTILSGGIRITQKDLTTLSPSLTILMITGIIFLIFSWTGKKLDKGEGIILASLFVALILAELTILLV
jgi:cation:H+ antiporter